MHNHQFIKTSEIDRNKYGPEDTRSYKIIGAVVVCTECGEVREIWEDGKVEKIWP